MNLRAFFTEPPPPTGNPVFRYGMLVFCLLLLANYIHWRLTLPESYPYDRNGNAVVVLMLLLNHLAYQFRWPVPVTIALRVLSWCWLMFGTFYILYWTHILYPRP